LACADVIFIQAIVSAIIGSASDNMQSTAAEWIDFTVLEKISHRHA
jgi:hypothetical protein